jgi:hypothetical protein
MAIGLEKELSVLEFHSTKTVITVWREFRRKFERIVQPRIRSERGSNNLRTQDVSARRRLQVDQVWVQKQPIVIGRPIGEVQEVKTSGEPRDECTTAKCVLISEAITFIPIHLCDLSLRNDPVYRH